MRGFFGCDCWARHEAFFSRCDVSAAGLEPDKYALTKVILGTHFHQRGRRDSPDRGGRKVGRPSVMRLGLLSEYTPGQEQLATSFSCAGYEINLWTELVDASGRQRAN